MRVGDPGKTRTSDLRFRKPSLYPAELRDREPAGSRCWGASYQSEPGIASPPDRPLGRMKAPRGFRIPEPQSPQPKRSRPPTAPVAAIQPRVPPLPCLRPYRFNIVLIRRKPCGRGNTVREHQDETGGWRCSRDLEDRDAPVRRATRPVNAQNSVPAALSVPGVEIKPGEISR